MTVTEDQRWEHSLGLAPSVPSPTSAREAINEMLDAGLLDDVRRVADHRQAGVIRRGLSGGRRVNAQ